MFPLWALVGLGGSLLLHPLAAAAAGPLWYPVSIVGTYMSFGLLGAVVPIYGNPGSVLLTAGRPGMPIFVVVLLAVVAVLLCVGGFMRNATARPRRHGHRLGRRIHMDTSSSKGRWTMTLSDLNPAERHRRIAASFSDRVRGVTSWDVPSPVAGWTARDVVRHLLEWLPSFLAPGASLDLPSGPSVDDDPVAAWRAHCDGVQRLLDDPRTAQRVLVNRHIGEVPLDQAIDRFYTSDVFMHTWDLARATGQDDRLDTAFCEVLLAGMEPLEDTIRSSGQFGTRVPTAADADVQTRLIGFIGRDPFWTPR